MKRMSALLVEGLSKTYSDGKEALSGINLEVKEGDFFALLGPNGAGKSTTIGIITGLVEKTSGTIKIFGHDSVQEIYTAKSLIGVVPQEFNFNQFEAVEDIIINQAGYYGVPKKEARKRCEELLEMLELSDKRKVVSRNLSGGMKRRLMIARALVHKPKLLILDEPTAGVDITIRRATWEFLKKINEAGTTIILTTHYLEEAELLCKHVGIINDGMIVESTSMEKLLRRLEKESFVIGLSEPTNISLENEAMRFVKLDEVSFEVTIGKPQTVHDVFDFLSTKNIKVEFLRNKANRLEELFLNLTTKN